MQIPQMTAESTIGATKGTYSTRREGGRRSMLVEATAVAHASTQTEPETTTGDKTQKQKCTSAIGEATGPCGLLAGSGTAAVMGGIAGNPVVFIPAIVTAACASPGCMLKAIKVKRECYPLVKKQVQKSLDKLSQCEIGTINHAQAASPDADRLDLWMM